MADLTVESALVLFERHEDAAGYEAAVTWLHSAFCVATAATKAGVVFRIGRRNLERIRVSEGDLRRNRPRPGIFGWQ